MTSSSTVTTTAGESTETTGVSSSILASAPDTSKGGTPSASWTSRAWRRRSCCSELGRVSESRHANRIDEDILASLTLVVFAARAPAPSQSRKGSDPIASTEASMSTPPNLAGLKALIVDADGTVRESLLRILRELGADAAEAESGPRGLAEATRARSAGRPFDLFFVAASMSPMNGIEFAEHLRKHPTEFARTILLVTPLTAVADLSQARAAGITLRVSKPILRAAIVSAVAEALSASLEPREPPAAASPPRRRVRVLLA